MQIITKSIFTSCNICPKAGWLQRHHPELANQNSLMSTGNDVGDIAMGLFGPYYEVPFGKLDDMIAITKEQYWNHKVLCEASFKYEDLFCSVDILKIVNKRKKTVEIYEVKATGTPKDYHMEDIAFQCYVLRKLGYTILKASLVYINNNYVYYQKLNIKKLFDIKEVTNYTEIVYDDGSLEDKINHAREIVSSETEPKCLPSVACHKPFDCSFFDCCIHLPENEPTVFDICRMPFDKKISLYNEGIVSYSDIYSAITTIPEGSKKPSLSISDSARIQVESFIKSIDEKIEKDKIAEFLNGFEFPLYFLDYETINDAVPKFTGVKPFERLPFQYSLHILHEDGSLEHKEFLADENVDPRLPSVKTLLSYIGNKGTIIAYNDSYEKSIITFLAEKFPKYKDKLMALIPRFKDLMLPFSKKWYYKKEFGKSCSIKVVLPVLFPDDPSLNYKHLDLVQNGTAAMDVYRKLPTMSKKERSYARFRLLRYCELDTFAMVKIYNHLVDVIS